MGAASFTVAAYRPPEFEVTVTAAISEIVRSAAGAQNASADAVAHASYLSQNRNRKVRLEGHADERGSREYNMALGQRRAIAVRNATTALGVGGDRIEAISFGEDKPKATGHDEASWAQNRRVEIVYDGE